MRNRLGLSILIILLGAACFLIGCSNGSSSTGDTGIDSDTTSDSVSDSSSDTGTDVVDPDAYTVRVNGLNVPVTRIDRFQTPVQFVRFDLDQASTVEISLGAPVPEFKLSPQRLQIATTSEADTISFSVTQPAYLVLSPTSMERLFVLVDPPETAPPVLTDANVSNIMDVAGMDNTGATLVTGLLQTAIDAASDTAKDIVYVPPGIYLTGELWLRDNMTLYLAEGALLKASSTLSDIVTDNEDGSVIEQCLHAIIRMNGVTNSHLKGRGMIDAGGTYLRDKEVPETKYNLLKIEDSTDCTVDGVTSIDSSFWNTIVYRSDNILLTNFKVINHRKSFGWNETDGVDFDNATNSKLSNAFLYTGDDCMATKSDDIPDDYVYPVGVSNYPADPTTGEYIAVNNLVHEDVVCLTNSVACKIGTKTMGTEMGNVVFKNIDVVKCGRGLVIDNMDTARVHDITFENVEFEYVVPYDVVDFGIQEGTDWRISEGIGAIEDIFATNIICKDYDEGLLPNFRINGRQGDENYSIGAVRFTNVQVNDVHITDANRDDNMGLLAEYADDIIFE